VYTICGDHSYYDLTRDPGALGIFTKTPTIKFIKFKILAVGGMPKPPPSFRRLEGRERKA
jgi:hypothetical protein